MSVGTHSSKCSQQREAEDKRSTLRWAAEAVGCCMDICALHSTVYVSFRYVFLSTGCGAKILGRTTTIIKHLWKKKSK